MKIIADLFVYIKYTLYICYIKLKKLFDTRHEDNCGCDYSGTLANILRRQTEIQ